MKKQLSTYPLRLPTSLKAAVAAISKAEGTSINQFVATAVAEKLSASALPSSSPGARLRLTWRRRDGCSDERVASLRNPKTSSTRRTGDEPVSPFGGIRSLSSAHGRGTR